MLIFLDGEPLDTSHVLVSNTDAAKSMKAALEYLKSEGYLLKCMPFTCCAHGLNNVICAVKDKYKYANRL